ncbi:hypothetical protein BDQ12DRAFT_686194 [Crucibulum laeve]|uniref:Secreted protein n=1 Tax=Crucibulum laeve TaxID=68775 RepID=A0A5C3LVZ7_9AGAR|nr:hypothetical protein BDQ12DRAFT_686194 [Crucibulum laeve]
MAVFGLHKSFGLILVWLCCGTRQACHQRYSIIQNQIRMQLIMASDSKTNKHIAEIARNSTHRSM